MRRKTRHSDDADAAGAGFSAHYDAVVFDLLTALIDSWSLWNRIAGSEELGLRWRKAYLGLTYSAGAYRSYEDIVAEAAEAVGLPPSAPKDLLSRWGELTPWPEAPQVLEALARRADLAVVTNCSEMRGRLAALRVSRRFSVIVTAEGAGFYKPRREPYAMALAALGVAPERSLFVAGSAADLPGAAALGMPVYWHNRLGLPADDEAAPRFQESSLDRLLEVV
ncbi:MAG: HAD hydrolase-like protein [Kiloniellales bacterium]|nr:HAD hydrolase-like protein [Kiloniellales bacterium]